MIKANLHYRPDVDGLRAIAVLSVILFHVNESLLPGGFVGVDIFFVISGFLISRNILRDIGRGRFSLVDFYRRRVKRIAPPMLVVVGATLIGAQLLMLPEDVEKTAGSAIAVLMSLANVHFWAYHDTSYFAAASYDSPLLHLWSLGVEEQFYILWPLLLMLTARLARWVLFAVAAAVAAASFLLAEVLFSRDPSFVYFMLPTRAGELLMGALAAIAVLHGAEKKISAALAAPIAAVGLALMCAPLFLLSEDRVFPGLLAVPPTLSTAMLILAGHCGDNVVSRALAWKPLVWIGLISYSAYLWHWPLLALYQYGQPEVGVGAGLALVGLTFLLAWLTYRYIEQPARHSTAPALSIFLRQFILPAGAIGIAAITLMKLDGYVGRSSDYRAQLIQVRQATLPAHDYDYVCQRQQLSMQDVIDDRCIVGAESDEKPRAILWGDSNAAHYVGMLGAIAQVEGFRFRNLAVGSCPPIFGDPAAFVFASVLSNCREATSIMRQALNGFDVVVVSASWTSYQEKSEAFLNEFFDTVRTLADQGKLVIIIGKAPVIAGYDRRCREKAIAYPGLNCPLSMSAENEDVALINAKLQEFAESAHNVEYFGVQKYLCPQNICSAFDPAGSPIYYDHSHLTMKASWKLGQVIEQQGSVPAPLDLIASWIRTPIAKPIL